MSVKLEMTREQLPVLYAEVVMQNPLLGRIETQLRLIGWTNEEVRTGQLLAACRSNKSLKDRVMELEELVVKLTSATSKKITER